MSEKHTRKKQDTTDDTGRKRTPSPRMKRSTSPRPKSPKKFDQDKEDSEVKIKKAGRTQSIETSRSTKESGSPTPRKKVHRASSPQKKNSNSPRPKKKTSTPIPIQDYDEDVDKHSPKPKRSTKRNTKRISQDEDNEIGDEEKERSPIPKKISMRDTKTKPNNTEPPIPKRISMKEKLMKKNEPEDEEESDVEIDQDENNIIHQIEEQSGSVMIQKATNVTDSLTNSDANEERVLKRLESDILDPDKGISADKAEAMRTQSVKLSSTNMMPNPKQALDRMHTDGDFDSPFIAPLPGFLNRGTLRVASSMEYLPKVASMSIMETVNSVHFAQTALGVVKGKKRGVITAAMMKDLGNATQVIQSCNILEACNLHLEDDAAIQFLQLIQHVGNIQTLDLSHNELGPDGIKQLITTLKSNRKITEVDITDNKIGFGLTAWCKFLKEKSCNIKSLNISRNEIGNETVDKLCDALRNNKSLTSLDVSYNDLKPKGVSQLLHACTDNNRLKILSIRGNTLGRPGPEAVFALVDLLSIPKCSVRTLDISLNALGTYGAKELGACLKDKNRSVTALNVSENELFWEGSSAIANALKSNHAITNIDMSVNLIQGKGAGLMASAIAQNHKLKEVNLSGNWLAPDGGNLIGFALHAPRTSLETLELNWNLMGPKGVESIIKSLKTNKSLRKLGINNNEMGVAALKLPSVLENNKTLTHLDIRNQHFNFKECKAIAKALVLNKSIIEFEFDKYRSYLYSVYEKMNLEEVAKMTTDRNKALIPKGEATTIAKVHVTPLTKQQQTQSSSEEDSDEEEEEEEEPERPSRPSSPKRNKFLPRRRKPKKK